MPLPLKSPLGARTMVQARVIDVSASETVTEMRSYAPEVARIEVEGFAFQRLAIQCPNVGRCVTVFVDRYDFECPVVTRSCDDGGG